MLANSYYPRADVGPGYGKEDVSLPLRPQDIGPILDTMSSTMPLDTFNEELHPQIYPAGHQDDGASKVPPEPKNFTDPYLRPMLTRNERLRLTMLWYHTRDLVNDEEILAKIQTKVDLLKQLIGWEFAICGLLGNDIYTRLATAGLPLAILPRRESTCAHTVQQTPGSVFFIPDMSKDWRFANSPHVTQGGIRTYAGAQIRCQTGSGEDLPLGSLSVASNMPNEKLSLSQRDTLAKFADMVTEDIISGSRRRRAKQQQKNDDLLRRIFMASLNESTNVATMRALRQVFPKALVSLLPIQGSSIYLQDDGPVVAFPDAQTESAVWEDADYIEEALRVKNHEKLKADQLIRAIVARVRHKISDSALVLSTKDITHVFDDIDVRFVEGCAMVLRSIAQDTSLQNDYKAREHFMRGIAHQLRTPIHGILGSVDLLADNILQDSQHHPSSRLSNDTILDNLRMIKSSGRELMSTVNNVIKLNRWAESVTNLRTVRLSDLNMLESELMEDIFWLLPENRLDQVSVFFNDTIPTEVAVVLLDITLLRDCLHSLVLNALQNTTRGSVIVTISAPPNYSSIQFDVRDTGCGIALADQERIFTAYEKGNPYSTSAGLGLTLAAKIANALGGTVTLQSSELGKGSHFRAELSNPGLACPIKRTRPNFAACSSLPDRFVLIPSDPPSVLDEHFTLFLKARGLRSSNGETGALAVVSFMHLPDAYSELLAKAADFSLAVSLVPAGEDLSVTKEMRPNILFFSGPFTSDRLNEILIEARDVYVTRQKPLPKTVQLSPSMTKPSWSADTVSGVRPELDSASPSSGTLGGRRPTWRRNSRPQCLLVDDNLINLRIMRMYCDKRAYPYATALDGLQAIDEYKRAMEKTPISLILLDLQMPKCDGIEACKEIRAIEARERLQPTVIFIVTGQDSPSDKEKSFAAGADRFFVKPLALKSLDHAVAQIFDKLMENASV